MRVTYHKISDIDQLPKDGSLSDIDASAISDRKQDLKENLFSFTTLRAHSDGWLYIGTTNFANRIFWRFDLANNGFEDLHYQDIAHPRDIKIHRSLEWDPVKKVFYGVSSGLHNENEYFDSPGAAIFSYDPATKEFRTLGIPLPHEYTQTITLDAQRRLLYGFTYHTFSFYVFNVDTCKTIYYALPGSISHISAIDDDGCIWSTWGRNRHWIFRYDPAKNDIVWTRKRFPEGGQSYMYPGAGPIDCMLNGGDGYLYVALETGSLVRMDPRTIEFDHLGRPSPAPRIPALIIGDDSMLYGTCGDDANVSVFRFDRDIREFEIVAQLATDEERCFRPHDIARMGNRIFVGETDNPSRSGYLWEVELGQQN